MKDSYKKKDSKTFYNKMPPNHITMAFEAKANKRKDRVESVI